MNTVNIKKVFKIATQFIEIQEEMENIKNEYIFLHSELIKNMHKHEKTMKTIMSLKKIENYYYHLTKQENEIMVEMINFIKTNENSDAS